MYDATRGYPDRVPATELPFETASWGRRILALIVDYAACWGVMLLIYGGAWFGNGSLPSLYLTLLFIGESAFLMALSGGSFGQLATRLRVVRVDGSGRPLSLLMALLRQVLICLVIPPLVFRPDGRGLHDMICGSATVPLPVPDRGTRGPPVRLAAPRGARSPRHSVRTGRTSTRGAREDPMRTLTLRKAALVAALPLALSSLAACGNSSSQATADDPQAGPTEQPHRQGLDRAGGEDRRQRALPGDGEGRGREDHHGPLLDERWTCRARACRSRASST